MMKYISQIENIKDVKVLLRLDLNVPIKDGRVVDDFRIKKAVPTVDYFVKGAAKVIIISHIESEGGDTLEGVANHMKMMGYNVTFIKNYKNAIKEIESMPVGGIALLENVRDFEGEKKNDRAFAKELASLGDIYVNDAFSVSHREHASVSAITEFLPSYAGFLFSKEVAEISSAFSPIRPFLFILGGAKFDTKIPLVEKFLDIADDIFIGGALANDVMKYRGMEIGKSKSSGDSLDLSSFAKSPKVTIPTDVLVGPNMVREVDKVGKDECVYDAGPQTIIDLDAKIKKAKMILWNGPLGAYEMGYKNPTIELARLIKEATKNGAKSILGGGDTLATISELGGESEYTFVSTGGGAMLDFLANGTLPGIQALERRSD